MDREKTSAQKMGSLMATTIFVCGSAILLALTAKFILWLF